MQPVELSCAEFVHALSSKEPVPGGGGAAALVGAIGIALGNMVGNLTAGKQKYASVEAEVLSLMEQAQQLQQRLLLLVEEDAKVFAPLAKAYGMPRRTEQEAVARGQIMERALYACSVVPLNIMEVCVEAISLHARFAEIGAAIAISDVGCGVVCCKAGLQAASLNVRINTKLMKDREAAQALNSQAAALLQRGIPLADAVFLQVQNCL